MVGEALYALLTSLVPITTIVGQEITWAAFNEAGAIPALTYNTRDMRKQECRDPGQTKIGLLEIQLLANNEVELEQLLDAVTDSLDGYIGEIAGYDLSLDINTSEFDEKVIDLPAFYKVLRFDLEATKL